MDEPEQDLSHIHWMDYFAFSPFWDAKSNNNVLRTQRRIENPTYGHAEEKVELTSFRDGFEYIVAHSRPPDLFVIHRRPVLPDGARGPPTHAYFVLQDKVYMSPNLYDVVSVRMQNATHLLERTFDALQRARPSANPRQTAVWRSIPPGEKNKDDEAAGSGNASSAAAGTAAATGPGTETGTPAGGAAAPPGTAPSTTSTDEPASRSSGPDWHLFHALAATRASLPILDKLAASQAPVFDAVAEQRTLDQAAQAAVAFGRPQQSQQQQQHQQQQQQPPTAAPTPHPLGTSHPTPLDITTNFTPAGATPSAPVTALTPGTAMALGMAGTPRR